MSNILSCSVSETATAPPPSESPSSFSDSSSSDSSTNSSSVASSSSMSLESAALSESSSSSSSSSAQSSSLSTDSSSEPSSSSSVSSSTSSASSASSSESFPFEAFINVTNYSNNNIGNNHNNNNNDNGRNNNNIKRVLVDRPHNSKPEIPREIARLIFSLVPTYESCLRRLLARHYRRGNGVSDRTETEREREDEPPSSAARTVGLPHVQHARSALHLVEKMDSLQLFATIALRCCPGCMVPKSCHNPFYELRLHLFRDGEYVPFTKAHCFDAFVFNLDSGGFRDTFEALCAWKPRLHRIMKDLLLFPHFKESCYIWWYLCNTNSYCWNCHCPEVDNSYLDVFASKHPTWARDMILHHYCGELFFEELLLKFSSAPSAASAMATVLGEDVANRLKMSFNLTNPRKKLRVMSEYAELERSCVPSSDSSVTSESDEEEENSTDGDEI